jgi:molecular chaperone DnaK
MGDSKYHKRIDNKDWTPVELSSLILKKLKQDCSVEDDQIHDVVISVPAHFDEVRRKATMDAGIMAGLNVIGIVNEPVAAALYYATTRKISGKVLVYDLGGGTFDVTVMDVNGQQMDIICSQGDHALGGVDFDQKILELLEQNYRDKFGTELIGSEEDRAKYEDEAEDIKKTLSRRPVAKKMLYGPAGSMRVEPTREMFEEAISSLMSRTDILIEVALEEAGIKPSKIDKVLLVGGSTRIPLVQQRLEKMFGAAPETAVNVDECVALGAALHAGLTMLREKTDAVPAGVSNGL